MIVELIGPSGAGKTTLARRLDVPIAEAGLRAYTFDELERLDLEIGERALNRMGWRRLLVLPPLFWRHPRISFGILAIAIAHGPPFFKRQRRARRLLGHLLFVERLRQRDPDRLAVLHEAFLQRLWSLVIESRRLRLTAVIGAVLADYHDRFRPIAISLALDDKLAAERVFARQSRGRFNRDSSPKRRAEFARWLDYRKELFALLPDDAIALTLDASDDMADVARELAPILTRLAKPEPEADV